MGMSSGRTMEPTRCERGPWAAALEIPPRPGAGATFARIIQLSLVARSERQEQGLMKMIQLVRDLSLRTAGSGQTKVPVAEVQCQRTLWLPPRYGVVHSTLGCPGAHQVPTSRLV